MINHFTFMIKIAPKRTWLMIISLHYYIYNDFFCIWEISWKAQTNFQEYMLKISVQFLWMTKLQAILSFPKYHKLHHLCKYFNHLKTVREPINLNNLTRVQMEPPDLLYGPL